MAIFRKSPKRVQKSVVYIFCNGDTELNYFNERKSGLPGRNIKIITRWANEGSPHQFVKYIERTLRSVYDQPRDGDKVFCVFDIDQNSDDSIQKATNTKSKYIDLIISNPSFELWLLLHYEYYNGRQSTDETFTRLRNHVPNYSKPHIKPFFSQLQENEEIAIENAKKLRRFHEEMGINLYSRDANPHTCADKVLVLFNNLRD